MAHGADGPTGGPSEEGLPRGSGPVEPLEERPLSLVAAGASAALTSFLAGMLFFSAVLVAAWALDARSAGSLGDVLRAAGASWAVANLVPITVSGTAIGVPPLGFTAVSALLLARSSAAAARTAEIRSAGQSVRLAAAVAACYGVLGLLTLVPVSAVGVQASPLRAFLSPYLLAFVCAGVGAVRGAGLWQGMRARVAEPLLPAAGLVLWALTGGGALLLAIGLAVRHDDVLVMLRDLDEGAGAGGTAFILLLSLAYLPNAVVWAASFISGAGFVAGSGGLVSPFEVATGPLPSFPLLATVPDAGPSAVLWSVLLVPLVAAGMAGYTIRRSGGRDPVRIVSLIGATAVMAGAAAALAALVSSGPAGGEALRHLGPVPLLTAIFVAAEVIVGGVLGSLVRPAPDRASGTSHT